jgi:hypothetical protein
MRSHLSALLFPLLCLMNRYSKDGIGIEIEVRDIYGGCAPRAGQSDL